ncbi:tubulin-tyrosine ligase family-domain-containing protein [Dipodascopsis tothii]|uniref:tubulin-tyrosine ligase family-domain-containing protein n=1 Tax=Dipodascopsis tothii TaxID=44089 RepID=UPI0034CF8EFF
MQITNDDGPPAADVSPFVEYFVASLKRNTDWTISVALPDSQKSWISKAHFIGQNVTASFIRPGTAPGEPFEGPYDVPTGGDDEWTLLSGTPASCANIGLHHLYKERGPIDLVVSGPNFGRNSSAPYILSSGTIGGALEAALCGVKAMGVSFAYSTRTHTPEQIVRACDISVRLIAQLWADWKAGVELYSINVPIFEDLARTPKVLWTNIYNSRLGSAFAVHEYDPAERATTAVRSAVDETEVELVHVAPAEQGRVQFKWQPDLAKVEQMVAQSPEGTDALAVSRGFISVTPMRANYEVVEGYSGELVLDRPAAPAPPFTCVISYPPESYVYPLLLANVRRHAPAARVVTGAAAAAAAAAGPVVHFAEYEDLDFDRLVADPRYLACAYVYRKALIRKNYLAHAVANYLPKHPGSVLARHFPESYELELDYAEYLDEMLDEIYEFRDQLAAGDAWWILKPAMGDRGQGIRLFKTQDELQAIFDSFDPESDADDADDADDDAPRPFSDGVVVSQMRQFLLQRYVANPLVLPQYGGRKFHIRTYVVAAGALDVYVYRDMLALFSLNAYQHPDDDPSLETHLTNTCLQGDRADELSVARFWDLAGVDHDRVWDQICAVTGDAFRAAVNLGRMHFQALPNAFELYGLDFVVDANHDVHFLEVNAYPDFKQTGDDLKGLVDGLFAAVFESVVVPYFGGARSTSSSLRQVWSTELSGGW